MGNDDEGTIHLCQHTRGIEFLKILQRNADGQLMIDEMLTMWNKTSEPAILTLIQSAYGKHESRKTI